MVKGAAGKLFTAWRRKSDICSSSGVGCCGDVEGEDDCGGVVDEDVEFEVVLFVVLVAFGMEFGMEFASTCCNLVAITIFIVVVLFVVVLFVLVLFVVVFMSVVLLLSVGLLSSGDRLPFILLLFE